MTAIGVELVLGRLFLRQVAAPGERLHLRHQRRHPGPLAVLWPYALCSAISITSKYVLRVDGRHLWNPSNFGVSADAACWRRRRSPASACSGATTLAPMVVVWLLGSVIIWRVGRFHITATYVASFLLFSFVRSVVTGTRSWSEVAPITGPMYQLFIFFVVVVAVCVRGDAPPAQRGHLRAVLCAVPGRTLGASD